MLTAVMAGYSIVDLAVSGAVSGAFVAGGLLFAAPVVVDRGVALGGFAAEGEGVGSAGRVEVLGSA